MDNKMETALENAKNAMAGIVPAIKHINYKTTTIVNGQEKEAYFCSACKKEVKKVDKVCPHCKAELLPINYAACVRNIQALTPNGNKIIFVTELIEETLYVTLLNAFYSASSNGASEGFPVTVNPIAIGSINSKGTTHLFHSTKKKEDMHEVLTRINTGFPRLICSRFGLKEISANSINFKEFWSSFADFMENGNGEYKKCCSLIEHITLIPEYADNKIASYINAMHTARNKKSTKKSEAMEDLKKCKQNYPALSENDVSAMVDKIKTLHGLLLTSTNTCREVKFVCTCGNQWTEKYESTEADDSKRIKELEEFLRNTNTKCHKCPVCGASSEAITINGIDFNYTANKILTRYKTTCRLINMEKTGLLDDSILVREFDVSMSIKEASEGVHKIQKVCREQKRAFISERDILFFENDGKKWHQTKYDSMSGTMEFTVWTMTQKQIQNIMCSTVGRSGILDGWDFSSPNHLYEYEIPGVYQFPKRFLSFPGIAAIHNEGLKRMTFDICANSISKTDININGKTVEEICGVTKEYLKKFVDEQDRYCSFSPMESIPFTDGDPDFLSDWFWATKNGILKDVLELKTNGAKIRDVLAAIKKMLYSDLIAPRIAVDGMTFYCTQMKQYGMTPDMSFSNFSMQDAYFFEILENMGNGFTRRMNAGQFLERLQNIASEETTETFRLRVFPGGNNEFVKSLLENKDRKYVRKFIFTAGNCQNLSPKKEALYKILSEKIQEKEDSVRFSDELYAMTVEDNSQRVQAILAAVTVNGKTAVASYFEEESEELKDFLNKVENRIRS